MAKRNMGNTADDLARAEQIRQAEIRHRRSEAQHAAEAQMPGWEAVKDKRDVAFESVMSAKEEGRRCAFIREGRRCGLTAEQHASISISKDHAFKNQPQPGSRIFRRTTREATDRVEALVEAALRAAAGRIEALEGALRAMHFNHIADGTLCWCPDPKYTKNTDYGLVLREGYVHAPDCEMARAALNKATEEESVDR